jgi:hypothetical protein
VAESKRTEQREQAVQNLELLNKYEKEKDNRNLSVEQHYQKESGAQIWRNYSSGIDAGKDRDKATEEAIDITSQKSTDIAICAKILKERGTDKNITAQLSKAVADKSPGAKNQVSPQAYGREVVNKAQERLKPQDPRPPRENTKHQTAGHDNSYMKSIEMMKHDHDR